MASVSYVWITFGISSDCYYGFNTAWTFRILTASALPCFTQTGVLAAILILLILRQMPINISSQKK